MAAPTELVKGNALLLILSCLARQPMHGYGIVKEMRQLSEDYFVMGEGTLYPHLHQLERDGFVEGYWESAGGRERKLYRITESGVTALVRKKREWDKFEANVNRVLNASTEAVA